MARGGPSKQTQFRMPPWALAFIEQAARQRQTTKTQVVLDALECLREHELEELMAEGYETVGLEDDLLDAPETDGHGDPQTTW